MYRKQTRKGIQDWLALLNSKKHQEWLIVYVTTQEVKPGSTFLSMRNSTVLDKLRSDFSSQKRDRQVCPIRRLGNVDQCLIGIVVRGFQGGCFTRDAGRRFPRHRGVERLSC